MAKTTTPLTAQERVILFCTATGVSHPAVGITAHAMQSMAVKGFIVHDRESEAYALTNSGRAALLAILVDAGLTWTGPRGGSIRYEPTREAAMATSSTRCVTPSWPPTGSRTSGDSRFVAIGRGRSRSAYSPVQNDSGLPQGPAGAFGAS